MIEITELSKRFGDLQAVDDLSFRVEPGEVLGFLGPNGAGKSTTMKMLTGFLSPDSGRIEVYGRDLAREPLAVKSMLGYLPEGAPAYGDMCVEPFLKFVAQLRGIKASECDGACARVIEKLQLQSVRSRAIETLSKGFKRRVGLAQAIIHDPKVLILDEPTDGLDPNQKRQVRELIRDLAKDKIVIISTHILSEVNAVCSRAIIIDRGRLVADGTPAQLQAQSRYCGAVSFTLDSDIDEDEILKALPAADALECETLHGHKFTLLPKPNQGRELYAQFSQLIEKNRWSLRSIQLEAGRLDDVFYRLTGERG